MSENFKIMYRVLKTLDRYKGDEDFDVHSISAETLGVPETVWEQLMIEFARAGYIDGVRYTQTLGDKFPHIAYPITPRITLRGMEYLEENSLMKKAAAVAKGLVDVAK